MAIEVYMSIRVCCSYVGNIEALNCKAVITFPSKYSVAMGCFEDLWTVAKEVNPPSAYIGNDRLLFETNERGPEIYKNYISCKIYF